MRFAQELIKIELKINLQWDVEQKNEDFFFFVSRFQQTSNLREDFYFVYKEVYPQIRRLHKKSPHKKKFGDFVLRPVEISLITEL